MMVKERACLLGIGLALLFIAGCAASADEPAPQAETTVITLQGSTAWADGAGALVDGGTVTITASGTYVLFGTLDDGQIVIDAGKKDTVELVLSGVSVTSSQSAAIDAKQAEQTIITLSEGTENTLIDAASYAYPDARTDEPDAALFVKKDLTIRGEGALMVYGNFRNGIVSKGHLVIENGTIAVKAENHGIRGKDSVTIQGGSLTIAAGNDGIQAYNAGEANSGFILMEGGIINITAAHDGLQAESMLTVAGGEITILTGGGHTNQGYSEDESYKGIKSAGDTYILGGEISVDSLDDAIHADKAVTISGGELSLRSGGDGVRADETVSITGGTINILMSREGIESTAVYIGGGTSSILAANDGINASAVSADGQGDRLGEDNSLGGDSVPSVQVNISGGWITINAFGDGIDSNGIITMSGGTLYISAPISRKDAAIDYDISFPMSGGLLAASGGSDVAQTPDASSSQPSVIVYFSQYQTIGSTYHLTDASGNTILSHRPSMAFQCIVFSAPELMIGSRYRIYESTDGMLDSAALLYEFTVSEIITSVGENGKTQ